MRTLSVSVMVPFAISLLALSGCGDGAAGESGSTTSFDSSAGSSATSDEGAASSDSTTGADASSDTNASEDDGGFVNTDTTVESMCDPFAQDCGEGQKCVPFVPEGSGAWEANKCVDISGDGVTGDECTVENLQDPIDTCDGDNLCWQLVYQDTVLVGTCLPFCGGTADAPQCDQGSTCQITNDGAINVCMESCDPLVQDCAEGLGCYISGGQALFICQPVSGGYDEGAPCIYTNDCVPGFFCAAGESVPECSDSGCCTSYCDLSEADPCAATPGTECVQFFNDGEAPPLYDNLGVCIIPA